MNALQVDDQTVPVIQARAICQHGQPLYEGPDPNQPGETMLASTCSWCMLNMMAIARKAASDRLLFGWSGN